MLAILIVASLLFLAAFSVCFTALWVARCLGYAYADIAAQTEAERGRYDGPPNPLDRRDPWGAPVPYRFPEVEPIRDPASGQISGFPERKR
jgi:hypothetical protein